MVALPLALKLLLVLVSGGLGYRLATRLHREHGANLDTALSHARWLPVLALFTGVVGVLAWLLTLKPDLTWELPLWFQYWATAINWGAVLASLCFLFGMTLSLALSTRDLRGWPLLVIAVGTLGGIEWYQAKMLVPPSLGAQESPDDVVLQTSGQSCGAASGANLARWFGLSATEQQMADRFGTSSGTSAAQIIYGLRELGIEGTPVTIAPGELPDLKPPAILCLEGRSPIQAGHIVTYVGRDRDDFLVLDPLSGRVRWHSDRLPETWRGRAIQFERRQ